MMIVTVAAILIISLTTDAAFIEGKLPVYIPVCRLRISALKYNLKMNVRMYHAAYICNI